MAVLYEDDGSRADKVYGALHDGSVVVWDVNCMNSESTRGRLLARGKPDMLFQRNGFRSATFLMREAGGALERVSIDNWTKNGYFGVSDTVVEVDLETLQVVNQLFLQSAVQVLSEARQPHPLTIGTANQIMLWDTRVRPEVRSSEVVSVDQAEHIPTGAVSGMSKSAATSRFRVAHRGPLSILHTPAGQSQGSNELVWVAGRVTSIMAYDRRYFPQLWATVYSGATISSLRSSPHQLRHGSADHGAAGKDKHTLIAAGAYRGKGSLELYSLPASPDPATWEASSPRNRAAPEAFHNRVTASSSKLLSVANHGGKLAYSDSDGNIKWVERDASTPIRSWNINVDHRGAARGPLTEADDLQYSGDEWRLTNLDPPDDIVKLLIPTMPKSTAGHKSVGEDNLVIWTGEGRVGLVGFGKDKWDWGQLDEAGREHEEVSQQRLERMYESTMGQALRRQQDELNYMRGFGLGA